MKKLLTFCLIAGISMSFADAFGSLTSAANNPNTAVCLDKCDAGLLLKAMGKNEADAGKLAKTACNVACADKCFSGEIAKGSKTELAAPQCKDSLNKTFSGK